MILEVVKFKDELDEGLIKNKDSLWRLIIEQSRDGMVLLDQKGKVFDTNEKFAYMLGYAYDELQHLYVWDWDIRYTREELEGMIESINYDGQRFESRYRRKDGAVVDVELSNSVTMVGEQKLIFSICRDITQRKRLEKEVRILAVTDGLTGMLSRKEFLKHLQREIGFADSYGVPFSLIMYDMDNFKNINDNFGHLEGDKILRISAELVKSHIRCTDLATRWGGEEFIIMLPQTNLTSARIIAEKLRNIIAEYQFHKDFFVTASFGATDFLPQDNVDTLLKRLDDALYMAKNRGKNRVESLTK